MKEGWEIRKLGDTIQDVVYTTKVKSSDYKKIGLFPVISQEQQLISGYWDNPDDVYKVNKPIVVFGDHTKEVKYIDFDFVLGADGVKILLPINEIDSKYFFYYIKSLKISSLGYARHYRLLKEKNVAYPKSISEQQRIVSKLDSVFEKIDALKANAENNLKNAKDLFQQVLKKELEPKEGWKTMKLGDVCSIISGYAFDSKGYSNKKDDILLVCGDNIVHCGFRWETVKRWDKNKFDELSRFSIRENDIVLAMDRPWVKSGLKIAKVSKKELPSLLIQRTACIRTDEKVSNDYIYLALQNDCFSKYLIGQQTGVGVPHISGKQIMNYELSMPNLYEQQRIVSILDSLSEKCKRLEENYRKTAVECDALKQAVLREVMSVE